ncbi:DUF2092 domain-containing protein [Kaistia terrae]|uniref:DUF2092 domain-containing protein n=1 Tax=Kaistia terrae TaxID=537017 RepID=A0ABW0Q2I4_9HYPH|nr:DUF2092 domain-containing protein [Kaistia terrae]MCX5581737.1 DUF2092 domain-containing protein [Kaistia terrae]
MQHKNPRLRRRSLALATLAGLTALSATTAQADDAAAILKAMSTYVGSQQNIAFTFDTDIEVITPDLQKIQFASSGDVALSRPDKLRASRMGGYADVALYADGTTVTVLGKNLDAYAQAPLSGSTDQQIDRLRAEVGIELPAADLLRVDSFSALVQGVTDAKNIGRGVVEGVDCHHLAFRTDETDWQIWIQVGDQPIPRKYVITSKAVTGAPQYTLVVKDWKTSPKLEASTFAFTPPNGAKKVEISDLQNIDEVPSSAPLK